MGAILQVYDPVAMDEVKKYFHDYPYPEQIIYMPSAEAALAAAEALIINTEWDLFRQFDIGRIKALMAKPVVFDGRNIFDPVSLAAQGIDYYFIGKPIANSSSQIVSG
jgi:UDPglucose 6-dehydrogenase